MGKAANCSLPEGDIPLSSQFYQVIKGELWIFLIPVMMALVLVALFLEEMGFFFRYVHSYKRRHLYLWILGIYPVFSLTSIIGIFVPRSSYVCNFVASMSNMRWMTIAVFQLSVVRTILFFVNLVLWTDEKYDYGDVDYKNPNSYVNSIIGVSTFVSFYGYLLFYNATKNALQEYGLRAKFICIIIILVLCGLQSGILETLGAVGIIPCTPPFSILMRSQIIYQYAIIVEMFFIGFFARHVFRKVDPSAEGNCSENESPEPKANKCIQTEYSSSNDPGFSDVDEISLGVNHGYHSDSEDSLCRIEHAPFDKFHFALAHETGMNNFNTLRMESYREPKNLNQKPSEGQSVAPVHDGPAKMTNCFQVKAQINHNNANKATVV
nr:PREDICTED: uncharacterized protein LOC106705382 isoform X2 [Latimeria chalumnae]|eukprot:XP_014350157.1 PREDICTED: uncharacterized protein LOC106705382 isoform X2 [Latimeria chalumnae]